MSMPKGHSDNAVNKHVFVNQKFKNRRVRLPIFVKNQTTVDYFFCVGIDYSSRLF